MCEGSESDQQPITHVGINMSSTVGDTDGFLVGVPIVADGKEGNVCYARTPHEGEDSSSVGVHVRRASGEKLRFRPGALTIRLSDVDKYAHEEAGYRPVANTVWTWLVYTGCRDGEFFRYANAAARRLDAAGFGLATMATIAVMFPADAR